MNFSNAARLLEAGHALTHTEWNDPGAWVVSDPSYQDRSDIGSHLMKHTAVGPNVPCALTSDEKSACDWEVVSI